MTITWAMLVCQERVKKEDRERLSCPSRSSFVIRIRRRIKAFTGVLLGQITYFCAPFGANTAKQIPLLIQSCRQRYRYFTAKNIDRISTYKNKRCILGVFHPSCNAFLIVFIAPPRDLTQYLYRPIVKQPPIVKRLITAQTLLSGRKMVNFFKSIEKMNFCAYNSII